MKVGLIGESVIMHYLDYYCETHKDRIAGFSDVREDKKYQEDDIDFVVYRKDGSSFTVEAKADTYKTGNVFLEKCKYRYRKHYMLCLCTAFSVLDTVCGTFVLTKYANCR